MDISATMAKFEIWYCWGVIGGFTTPDSEYVLCGISSPQSITPHVKILAMWSTYKILVWVGVTVIGLLESLQCLSEKNTSLDIWPKDMFC